MNNKGFILMEALVSMVIVTSIILLLVPLSTLITQERKVLKDRRMISTILHDELQDHLWLTETLPKNYEKNIATKTLTFQFTSEAETLKGCVSWKNVRKKEEEFCLFGYVQE